MDNTSKIHRYCENASIDDSYKYMYFISYFCQELKANISSEVYAKCIESLVQSLYDVLSPKIDKVFEKDDRETKQFLSDMLGKAPKTLKIKEQKMPTNARGFVYQEFTDRNSNECIIETSQAGIWLGPKVLGLKEFISGNGWRMHLTQENVKFLLPLLQEFAETGNISPKPAS